MLILPEYRISMDIEYNLSLSTTKVKLVYSIDIGFLKINQVKSRHIEMILIEIYF